VGERSSIVHGVLLGLCMLIINLQKKESFLNLN